MANRYATYLDLEIPCNNSLVGNQTKADEKVLPSVIYVTFLVLPDSPFGLTSWRAGKHFYESKHIKFIVNASIPDSKHGFQQIGIAF